MSQKNSWVLHSWILSTTKWWMKATKKLIYWCRHPLKNQLVLHCGWNEPTSSDEKIETKVKSIIGDDKMNFSVGDFLEEYSDVPIVNKNYPTHMIASYVFNQFKTRESGHCVIVP